MILVADSGSTQTTWGDVDTGTKTVTEGLNPHFTTEEQFRAACDQLRATFEIPQEAFRIHFYGAGCGLAAQRRKIVQWTSKHLGTNDIQISTDMLGACRATAGSAPALVAILGTGSNVCMYDGQRIVHQPTSTGYILGDEGSANHVGRMLLNDYLTHRMPTKLRHMFHGSYPMSDAQLIDAVYHRSNPNRFLASLAPFAVARTEEDYCHHIVDEALHQWYFEMFTPMLQSRIRFPFKTWDGAVHFVGGYAKAIESHLHELFHDGPFHVGNVVADPIDGLIAFHNRDSKNS